MTTAAIGSVLPAPSHRVPPRPDSVWEAWTGGFANVSAYRTARGALQALLDDRKVGRVWLPAYVCDALARGAAGREIAWYPVGRRLDIEAGRLLASVRPGDAVVVVDYFGRSPTGPLREFAAARPDVLWIEDRAQALEPDQPRFGEVLLFSPRKLFGVADGGLLVSDRPLPAPAPGAEPAQLWAANDGRASDPDGADPDSWFPAFRRREAEFTVDAAPMSGRTEAVLRALAWGDEAEARRANWRVLAQRLPEYALWPDLAPAFAPLAFPVTVEDAGAAAVALAQRRIWCARHWPELPSPRADFSEAHELAAHCLSLPLDSRYGAEDMERVAVSLREAARPAQPR